MMKEVFTHRILEWRRIRFQAHQQGHKPDDIGDTSIVTGMADQYPEARDEQLILWDGEDWIERIAKENVIYKASTE